MTNDGEHVFMWFFFCQLNLLFFLCLFFSPFYTWNLCFSYWLIHLILLIDYVLNKIRILKASFLTDACESVTLVQSLAYLSTLRNCAHFGRAILNFIKANLSIFYSLFFMKCFRNLCTPQAHEDISLYYNLLYVHLWSISS